MRLRFLGKATQGGGSPTLFPSDRATYVVQGWRVTGASDKVEIPHRLLAHLEPGTCLGVLLEDTGSGSFLLSGQAVTDSEALSYMNVPGHRDLCRGPAGQGGTGRYCSYRMLRSSRSSTR